MLRKLFLVPVLALVMIPAVAQAQFEQGNYSLTLSGSGSNDQDFTTGQAALNFELGYFLTNNLSLGVRQGILWADGGSDWSGATFVFTDFHFDMDRWQPYVGANIGYAYGDDSGQGDAWYGGPEGGVKYFVNATTFIDARISYQFNLEDGLDEGGFIYGLGIGFKW